MGLHKSNRTDVAKPSRSHAKNAYLKLVPKLSLTVFVLIGSGCRDASVQRTTVDSGSAPATEAITTPSTLPRHVKQSDEELTSDSDLIKWKDDPMTMKGKRLKVKATHRHAFDLSKHTGDTIEFCAVAKSSLGDVPVYFRVRFNKNNKLPNAGNTEVLIVVFDCIAGDLDEWNALMDVHR